MEILKKELVEKLKESYYTLSFDKFVELVHEKRIIDKKRFEDVVYNFITLDNFIGDSIKSNDMDTYYTQIEVQDKFVNDFLEELGLEDMTLYSEKKINKDIVEAYQELSFTEFIDYLEEKQLINKDRSIKLGTEYYKLNYKIDKVSKGVNEDYQMYCKLSNAQKELEIGLLEDVGIFEEEFKKYAK